MTGAGKRGRAEPMSRPDDDAAYERGLAFRRLGESKPRGWEAACVEGAVEDDHPFARSEAARALAGADDETVVPLLARALDSANPAERFRALRLLLRRSPEQAAAALLGEVRSSDRTRALRAVDASGKMGEAGLAVLDEAARSGDATLRAHAVKGIGQSGSAEALPTLREALRDREPSVRRAAARSLARLVARPELREAARELAPTIAAMASDDDDGDARTGALVAAARLGSTAPSVERLAGIASRGDGPDASAAMLLLGRGAGWTELVSLAGEGGDRGRAAAAALAGGDAPSEAYLQLLRSCDASIRASGLRGLALLQRTPEITAALEAARHDEDAGTRWLARRALSGALAAHVSGAHGDRPPPTGPSARWPFGLPPPTPGARRRPRRALAVAVLNPSYNLNLGVLVRSAEAAGAAEVLVAGRDFHHLPSAMGADRWLEMRAFATGEETLLYARSSGYQIVAVQQSPGAERFDRASYPPRPCLLLGSEGQGIPPALCAAADMVVEIPLLGEIDSINVASAGAVVLWACLASRGWLDGEDGPLDPPRGDGTTESE